MNTNLETDKMKQRESKMDEVYDQIDGYEISELMTVAIEEDISLAGFHTVEDIREYLKKEFLVRRTRKDTSSLWNDQRQSKLREDNEYRRRELATIYTSTASSLSPSTAQLNHILSQNRKNYDLSRDILSHMTALEKGECNVLIAGETNAGKSTLLNLLMGIEVLPKSILGCTSDICKLRYSPTFSVLVVRHDRSQERFNFTDCNETKDFLEQAVASQTQGVREQGPCFREVHIEVPADILKGGITIVDSPGFGENAAMDAVASDFVTNNNVAAFIYVIKTDSNGGVQEGRLIKFLRNVLNIKVDKADGSKYFDPKAALFVCNRWDLVSNSEKPKVRDHVLLKLKTVWPNLQDEQVCFFSSKAREASAELETIHQSLDTLFTLARDVVTTNSFCWLKHIVKECAFCLRTIVGQTNKEKRNLNDRLRSATERLPILETKTRDVMKDLKHHLEESASEFRETLKEFLRSKEMHRELGQWEVEDIPEFCTFKDYRTKTRDETIIERIVDILDECAITNDFIRNFENRVEDDMSTLTHDMDVITNTLRDSSDSMRSSVGSRDFDAFGISTINESLVRQSRTHGNPLSSLPIVELSRSALRRAASTLRKLLGRSSVPNANQPYDDMAKRSRALANLISSNSDVMDILLTRYTSSIKLEIDRLVSRVPTFVSSIQNLITEITSISLETQITRNDLQRTMESLEQQKQLLAGYGCLYVNDITNNDIMLYMDDPSLKKSTSVSVVIEEEHPDYLSRVLWTRFLRGRLSADHNVKPITVRYYIQQPADRHLYREIAKLRCLDHFSVAGFIGMTRAESQSAFIFREELCTAQSYLRRPTTDLRCTYSLAEAVPRLVEGLMEGLEYIHKDGLVHMELNANTVMVNSSGTVKLAGMCLPRQASFPLDCDSIEAGDFSCLSPEVLQGAVYTKEADIYSFGLFLAEIMLPDRPFKVERTWSLTKFRQTVDPGTMVEIPSVAFSKCLHVLLKGCLLSSGLQRLSIEDVRALVQGLSNEGLFNTLDRSSRNNQRRPSALWSHEDFAPHLGSR